MIFLLFHLENQSLDFFNHIEHSWLFFIVKKNIIIVYNFFFVKNIKENNIFCTKPKLRIVYFLNTFLKIFYHRIRIWDKHLQIYQMQEWIQNGGHEINKLLDHLELLKI